MSTRNLDFVKCPMLDGRYRNRQSRIHAQICAMTAEMALRASRCWRSQRGFRSRPRHDLTVSRPRSPRDTNCRPRNSEGGFGCAAATFPSPRANSTCLSIDRHDASCRASWPSIFASPKHLIAASSPAKTPLAMSTVPAADVAQVALLTTRGRWPRPPFKRPRNTHHSRPDRRCGRYRWMRSPSAHSRSSPSSGGDLRWREHEAHGVESVSDL